MSTQNNSTKSNENNSKVIRYKDAKGLPPTQQKPPMPTVKPPKEATNNGKKS